MEFVELNRIVEKLESGSREKGGSINSGIISIGGTHLSTTGGFKWEKKEFVSEDFFSKMRTGKVLKNDILIVKDGATTGKTSFVDNDFPFKDAAINEHVFRIQINPELANPKYVFYFLHSANGQEQILSDFRGATVGGISRGFIDLVKIPLYDIETQNKIVAILDKAKALQDKREKTIAMYEELLRAIFSDMFSKFIGTNVFPLSAVADITSGLTKGKNYIGKSTKMIPYMRVANVQDGFLDLKEIKKIEATEDEIVKYNLENDDLLLTEGGDPDKLGRGTLWKNQISKCIFQNHIFRVRVRNHEFINSVFLSFQVSSMYGKNYFLKAAKQTSGIASINSTQLKAFPVYVPPIEIQLKFAGIVEKLETIKSKFHLSIQNIQNLLSVLSQYAFQGKLTFNTSVDLELLLENDYNFFRQNSSIKTIQLLLDRLDKSNLNELKFYESEIYDKAKYFVFELLKEGKIKQLFDENDKTVKLVVG
ncbi:MAG: restriction endonuclease subunit S [Sporocytophaga sp.]|uniref:restriction endonuclease subunit S n=1 Tax=Sporocytophaga sp. TaxID=2231183 RepID=UPI001B2BF0E7|nr:restriction endonuclease subunit S [Sporocytophaga sp.]MBO9703654.1 restriction endonuclease subunit S [Sporocytophaga sp.]